MKKFFFAVVLAILPTASFAQSVTFDQPVVKAKANRPIFITPKVDGDDLMWEIDKGLDDWVKMLPPDVAKNFGASKIFYAEKGTYVVRAWTAKLVNVETDSTKPAILKAKLSSVATLTIVVDDGAPPVPVPPTDSAILGPGGLRILMIFESSKTLPAKQASIMTSTEVRNYLASKTAPLGASKRGFYIVDKDVDFSAESKEWGAALLRPRTSVPWVIISTDKGNFEGPWPADVPSFMQLLKKYGG